MRQKLLLKTHIILIILSSFSLVFPPGQGDPFRINETGPRTVANILIIGEGQNLSSEI